jgi:hypothetical protein
MIKVTQNENFPQYVQLYWGTVLVEEYRNTSHALREAVKMAKAQGQHFMSFLGEYKEVA